MAGVRKVMGKKFFRDWKDLNDNWGKAVERNMDRKVEVDRASKQVVVRRLKRNERAGGWQPEPLMGRRDGLVDQCVYRPRFVICESTALSNKCHAQFSLYPDVETISQG